MVELSLRRRVELEKTGQRRKSVLNRKVNCKNNSPTGDPLMDEALKHLKETQPTDTVGNWIELFCGEYRIHYSCFCVYVGEFLKRAGGISGPLAKCHGYFSG